MESLADFCPLSWSNLSWEKAHKLFLHKLFGPHPKPPFWAPTKKLMCLISWERTPKRAPAAPHKLCRGDSGGQNRGPKRAIFSHKKFSLLFFFPALNHVWKQPLRSVCNGAGVDPAEWPKIGLLNRGFASILLMLPRKKLQNTEFTKLFSVQTVPGNLLKLMFRDCLRSSEFWAPSWQQPCRRRQEYLEAWEPRRFSNKMLSEWQGHSRRNSWNSRAFSEQHS